MNYESVSLKIKIVLLVVILLIGLFKQISPRELYQKFRKPVIAVLFLCAILAFGTFFRFGQGIHGHFLHYHDISHYYWGAKYADELGYFNMYRCIVIAEAEAYAEGRGQKLPKKMRERKIRVLEDYSFRTLEDIVQDPLEVRTCKDRFTEERWKEFKLDIDTFYDVQHHNIYYDRCNDMGYNGSPVWGMVAGRIANWVPISKWNMYGLALLDPILLLLGFFMLFLAFGAEIALITMTFFYSVHFNHSMYIHGSFMRFDWMAFIMMGISTLKMGRYKSAGALLAYAGVVRLFPALLVFGLGCKWLWEIVEKRKIARKHFQFGGAYLLTVILLVGASATTFGVDYYREYVDKLELHSQVISSTRAGFPYVARRVVENLEREYSDKKGDRSWKNRDSRQDRTNARIRILTWSTVCVFLLIIGLISRRQEEYEAVAFSYIFVFFSLGLTVYYCPVISLLALLFIARDRDWLHIFGYAGLLVLMMISWYLFFFVKGGTNQNFWISIGILIFICIICLLLLFRQGRIRNILEAGLSRPGAVLKRRGFVLAIAGMVFSGILISLIFFGLVRLGETEKGKWQEGVFSYLDSNGYDSKHDVLVVSPSKEHKFYKPVKGKNVLFMDNPQEAAFFPYQRAWIASLDQKFHPDRYKSRKFVLDRKQEGKAYKLFLMDFRNGNESLYNFRKELESAEVSIEGRRAPKPCRLGKDGRFICARNNWNYVGATKELIKANERELIWAHPVKGSLNIRYPKVKLGRSIRLGTCLTDFAADLENGAAVSMEVFADTERIGSVKQENRHGWFVSSLDTARLEGEVHDLHFRITSSNAGRRHFCFNGDILNR